MLKNAHAAKPHTMNLTEGPIFGKLFVFMLPLLLTNLLQQLYSTVDSVVVGKFVGTGALAAVGTCGQLAVFLIYFFIGISVGASILISQAYGAGDETRVRALIHVAVGIALVAGIFLMVFGLVCSPTLLRWMSVPDEVMPYAVTYMRIYFLGMIPMMVYNMGSGILRAVGDTRTSLYALVFSACVNVALDLLLVAALNVGVAGAAWATTAAQVVSALMILHRLLTTDDICRLELKKVRLERRLGWQIIKIGVPTGLQSMLICFANVIVQTQINGFGLAVMAGYTSYVKLDAFLYMPTDALSLTMSNFIGQNVGAGKTDRVKKSMLCGFLLLLGISYLLVTILMTNAHGLLSLFSSDEEVIYYGKMMMYLQAPLYGMYACNQIFSGSIRGLGKASVPMLINLVCMCALRITFISVTLKFIWDVRIVYASYPLTWGVTLATFIVYFIIRRPIKRLMICPENFS